MILTFNGAAVFHTVKKVQLIVDSSMESEAIGTSKTSETVAYAREILRAFGIPPDHPTVIGTDNLANHRVASGLACPSRSKHFLRRYAVLKQRIASGEVTLRHVPDTDMPADFMTKFAIPSSKLEQSVRYATNSRRAPKSSYAAREHSGGMRVGGAHDAVWVASAIERAPVSADSCIDRSAHA